MVSWKDAADRNELVASEALATPRMTGSKVEIATVLRSLASRAFSRATFQPSASSPGSHRSLSPTVIDAHLLEHLTNDQLDVLVVDLDALRR